jgi:hypothetical protein
MGQRCGRQLCLTFEAQCGACCLALPRPISASTARCSLGPVGTRAAAARRPDRNLPKRHARLRLAVGRSPPGSLIGWFHVPLALPARRPELKLPDRELQLHLIRMLVALRGGAGGASGPDAGASAPASPSMHPASSKSVSSDSGNSRGSWRQGALSVCLSVCLQGIWSPGVLPACLPACLGI